MNLLSQITLKWYDDSSLMTEDKRALVELFLDSIGITRETAADIFEVLLIAKAKDISITSSQIREGIIELRTQRGKEIDKSLTMRNIQIWIKFYRNLGFLEKIGNMYAFKGNRRPSTVFKENIKPAVIDNSADYVGRILEKLEDRYKIKTPKGLISKSADFEIKKK
jgi:hypothetical protein